MKIGARGYERSEGSRKEGGRVGVRCREGKGGEGRGGVEPRSALSARPRHSPRRAAARRRAYNMCVCIYIYIYIYIIYIIYIYIHTYTHILSLQ